MRLRPATAEDAAALADLWFESWASNGFDGHPDTREMMIERVPRELAGRWDVTIAEADGRMLGFLALAPTEQRLDQVFVASEAQGQGVGTALFAVAVQRLGAGFWLTTQQENLRARAFYERRGMTLERFEEDRVYYRLAARSGDFSG